jgi:hypothetical protein
MLAYILASASPPEVAVLTAIMIFIMVFFAIHHTPRKEGFKDYFVAKPPRHTNADLRRCNTRPAKDKHIVVRQNDNNKRYRVNKYGEVFEE